MRVGYRHVAGAWICVYLIAHPGTVAAQFTLPTVTVTGTRPVSDRLSELLAAESLKQDATMVQRLLDQQYRDQCAQRDVCPGSVAVVKQFVTDVRCYQGPGSTTTSTADAEAKHGVAVWVFHNARLTGATRGSRLTVTWADGGSTTYLVVGGVGTPSISPMAVAETPGSGVVEAGPVCGKG